MISFLPALVKGFNLEGEGSFFAGEGSFLTGLANLLTVAGGFLTGSFFGLTDGGFFATFGPTGGMGFGFADTSLVGLMNSSILLGNGLTGVSTVSVPS